ncbi:MAG TPA: hypothetical protein VFM59_07570 [Salinimicrobium sp.]|nr:hypothetical protein [Salinimicrobium sp.]
MRKLILIIFLFSGFQSFAQEFSIKKGAVLDSIPVNDSISETFAIYLPRDYQPNGSFPVIFVFDPEGRGRNAVQLFKAAAENQGYVIAASNNILSEKTLAENLTSAAYLIENFITMISVDLNSVSVAGFSEGARVAIAVPALFDGIFGVIAVGNHQINFKMLEKLEKFFFIAITGNAEIADYGVDLTVQELKNAGFPAVNYSFQGEHEWPDANLISSAVGSLTLEAMKTGKRAKDVSLINELYQQDIGRANKLISTGSYLQASEFLSLLESKYEDLYDLSEIREKQRNLQLSRNYREQEQNVSEVKAREFGLLDDFIYYLNEDIATANFANLGWWNYQKLQLEEFRNSENKAEAAMGNRLLTYMDELVAYKTKEMEATIAPLENKLLAYMLQTVFDQTDFDAYKKVISLSAKDYDFPTALFYLEEMLKNGYKDMESLYEIEGTLGLKITPEFNWLIKKYLGSSKFFEEVNPFLND